MNKKIVNISLKTMGIKARVANFIRTALYKKRLQQITDKEKIELFDKIWKLNDDAHFELNMYKSKRKAKAEIWRLREERGWKPKVKTPKPENKFGKAS
jgi:hypothetical protein